MSVIKLDSLNRFVVAQLMTHAIYQTYGQLSRMKHIKTEAFGKDVVMALSFEDTLR